LSFLKGCRGNFFAEGERRVTRYVTCYVTLRLPLSVPALALGGARHGSVALSLGHSKDLLGAEPELDELPESAKRQTHPCRRLS
jgi:hypothetical protein